MGLLTSSQLLSKYYRENKCITYGIVVGFALGDFDGNNAWLKCGHSNVHPGIDGVQLTGRNVQRYGGRSFAVLCQSHDKVQIVVGSIFDQMLVPALVCDEYFYKNFSSILQNTAYFTENFKSIFDFGRATSMAAIDLNFDNDTFKPTDVVYRGSIKSTALLKSILPSKCARTFVNVMLVAKL